MEGEYAHVWAMVVKKNEYVSPSINEVVMGLYQFHIYKLSKETHQYIIDRNPQKWPQY